MIDHKVFIIDESGPSFPKVSLLHFLLHKLCVPALAHLSFFLVKVYELLKDNNLLSFTAAAAAAKSL